MPIKLRPFDTSSDIDKVSQFLVDTYYDPSTPQRGHINWLQSRWEYMHYHPLIADVDRSKFGVWEDGGSIVGVAHPEHPGSPCYFEMKPGYEFLKSEILNYYEEKIRITADGLENHEGVYLIGGDEEFAHVAEDAGYSRSDSVEPMSVVSLESVPDSYPIPEGFTLQSLAEDDDPAKSNRVLHQGFEDDDEPGDDGIAGRKFMQSAPNFNRELNIVAVAPNGDWVSYSGMWFEPTNRYCYVEPVTTVPDFRLMGLGKAAITESIRRAKLLGAEISFVGATLPIYKSIGFEQVYSLEKWIRAND